MMISRRKILSRSRDALNHSDDYADSGASEQSSDASGGGQNGNYEQDVWFNREKLIAVCLQFCFLCCWV